MAKLPILEFPDERLRTKAVPWKPLTTRSPARRRCWNHADARGIGLAATQIDVHRRVVVMDVDARRWCVNPRRPLACQGHLGLFVDPEYYAEVPRYLKVNSTRWIAVTLRLSRWPTGPLHCRYDQWAYYLGPSPSARPGDEKVSATS